MPGKHAILSPSSADRWMQCPGSVALSEGLEDSGSSYADEGTAAHFLAETCLRAGTNAAEYIEEVIAVSETEGAYFPIDGEDTDCFTLVVDEEFAAEVQKYVDKVREYAQGHELHVECVLPIDHLTGEKDATGTSDAVVVTSCGAEVQSHDLKFGKGKKVYAERNRQLMMYASSVRRRYDMLGTVERVRIVIHQPRLDHFPEWTCTTEELDAFEAEVASAARLVGAAIEFRSSWENDPCAVYLTPGEEQCRWCRAKADCPALAKLVAETIGAAFDDLSSVDTDMSGTPPADLSTKMQAIPLIEEWCKAVRARVESDLFSGVPVPGYKLVEGKRGNRAWSSTEAAEALLKDRFRLKVEEMYDLKLVSPTTAEKLQKAGKIGPKQWKLVQELITQSEGKPSVAPESDNRPALVIKPTADDFDDITGDGDDMI